MMDNDVDIMMDNDVDNSLDQSRVQEMCQAYIDQRLLEVEEALHATVGEIRSEAKTDYRDLRSIMRKEISKSKRRMSTVEEQPLVNFQLPQAESPSLIVPQNRRNRTQLADVPEESDHDDSDHDDPEHGDEVEMPLLPEDVFSFIAFSRFRSSSMATLFLVLIMQVVTLFLLAYDILSVGTAKNRLGVPLGVSTTTSILQILALIISVFSQTDYQDSLNTLFNGYNERLLEREFIVEVPYWRWILSIGVRFFISFFGLVVTFLLIVTNPDPTGLLLDFTSIEFISNLDNIFFWLATWGYLGNQAQRDGSKVVTAKADTVQLITSVQTKIDGTRRKSHNFTTIRDLGSVIVTNRSKRLDRFGVLGWLCLCCFSGWAIIFARQKRGEYVCSRIYVEFDGTIAPDLATLNGIYKYKGGKYVEEGHGGKVESAKFEYCENGDDYTRAWIFSYKDPREDGELPECGGQYAAWSRNLERFSQDEFDLMGTGGNDYFTRDRLGRRISMRVNFLCFDCVNNEMSCPSDRGVCNGNTCKCKDEWFGPRCEIERPLCGSVELDPLYPSLPGKWPERYELVTVPDDSDEDGGSEVPVEVYGRPVYQNLDGFPTVVFFNGYRWAIASRKDMDFNESEHDSTGSYFQEEFHAFRSNYTVSFLSTPVSIDEPLASFTPDGVVCNNETNACLFEGVCSEDSICHCAQRSSGRLCQIPPTGNGFCDTYFNTIEFEFDGGDCCPQTCVSTSEHTCGQGIVETHFGVEYFGWVGFKNCTDTSSLNVVGTLDRIKRRGYLECGTFRTSIKGLANFYSDQCRAIAAAIFGETPSFKVSYYTGDRFNQLKEGDFDVVFGSDFTAGRDVYEESSGSPFDFAALPSHFTGLVFGGVTSFVSCAEKLEECRDLKICVPNGTTFEDTVTTLFPASMVVVVEEDPVPLFEDGICNVMALTPVELDYSVIEAKGFTGGPSNYAVSEVTFTKSFETWMTRSDDRVWSQFVNWVMEALVQAEEAGVTSDTSYRMKGTTAFGMEYQDMFRNAVRAVGNYGDLWAGMPYPRRGLNLVNDGTSGLIQSMDLGSIGSKGPSPHAMGTIRSILDRGYLRCAVFPNEGFGVLNKTTSEWSGMDVDLCKGIAAAIFEGETKIEIVQVTAAERFTALEAQSVDVSFLVTRNLERQVKFVGTGGRAYDFTPIYFYDGMKFFGSMPNAKCAEDLDFFEDECLDTKICVLQGTTWLDAAIQVLSIPEEHLVITDTLDEVFEKHVRGECNVVAGETTTVTIRKLREAGYPIDSTEYYFGEQVFTKEPLGAISRDDDSQFSDFLRWVVYGFFYAEEEGITQERYEDMPVTNLFGDGLSHMWLNSVKAVGNYGEIYERNLNRIFPRSGYNLLNTDKGPQLYASPGTI